MYIGVDVGITTGVAKVDDTGYVLFHFTVDEHSLFTRTFEGFVADAQGFNICIEYPEPNLASSTPGLSRVINRCRVLFPFAYSVRPGVWKNSAIGLGPLPENVRSTRMSPHEKDAIRIALWNRARIEQAKEQVANAK
jgi:hypothetical protein